MTTTGENSAAEELEQKLTQVASDQRPAVEDSEWADEPNTPEVDEVALASAAKESAAKAEFDDTSHADGEQATPEPRKTPAPEATIPEAKPEQVPEEQAHEEEVPEFDDSLLRAAGLASQEEAKIQFGTPQALENAVRMMDRRAVEVAEHAMIQHQVWQRAQQQQQQQPVPQKTLPATPETPKFVMPEPPPGEEWDEPTKKLIQSLQEQFEARLAQQQAVIEQQAAFTRQIAQERESVELRRHVDAVDTFVDSLDDSWSPLLGRGSGYELDKNSLQLKNRVHLDTIAKQLTFGRAQQGLPELTHKETLERALRVAFPQRTEQVVRRQVVEEVSKRQSMMTNRPGSRAGGKPRSGDEAAAQRAEAWYAKRGMASLPMDDIEIDSV